MGSVSLKEKRKQKEKKMVYCSEWYWMVTTPIAYSFSVTLFCENDHTLNSLYLCDSVPEAFTLELLLQKFQVQWLWKVYCENQFSPPNISKEASVLCEHVFCNSSLETRWSSVISQLSSADTIIQLYLMPQWITPHYSLIFCRNLNLFLDCVFTITLDNQ